MIMFLWISEFLLHHLYTGGITKKTVNLKSIYPLKKPTAPPPHPQKRESTLKKVGVSSPILENCVTEYG